MDGGEKKCCSASDTVPVTAFPLTNCLDYPPPHHPFPSCSEVTLIALSNEESGRWMFSGCSVACSAKGGLKRSSGMPGCFRKRGWMCADEKFILLPSSLEIIFEGGN
ncbi:hypothetical protein CEXT_457851 [Caerostris extrusa]|uniref:Uncharacterized protein n=1 Tax=Caerostris extrusa TaxID=172846 RepID=A0AAV4P3D3_CAEEX|nr:hypothetical protein CEXT_457851 [Caerostris extrusa]